MGDNGGVEGVNGNVEGANRGESDFSTIIAKQLQNILPAMLVQGGAVVLTRWIEKIESVHDMSDCRIDQKVKYIAGSFVGKASTWWNSQILELSQLVQLYPIEIPYGEIKVHIEVLSVLWGNRLPIQTVR
nr:reverse transcriptase domain-containing protein [Tanacetum cinerariifolium]